MRLRKNYEAEKLRFVTNIQDWLKDHGKAEAFSNEPYSIDDTLLNFKYSKSELSQFKPEYRYISFKLASEQVKKLIGDIKKAERFLMDRLKSSEIFAFHPFVGTVTPELSMEGLRWRKGYFAEWQLKRLLENEFGEKETPENITKAAGNGGMGSQDKTKTKYEQYKNSVDELVKTSGIDLNNLTVEDIFKQVKQTDKNLWNIQSTTFKRNIWPKYSKENNLQKQPGRPRKK
ncbi:MAG: hypothetical protein PHO08_20510 [Methylococcales bacterium]|nr:hypothetical protein [Methylococcales bacterium]